MAYYTTTSYGTWCNQVREFSTSPDADVADYIGGGEREWQTLMDASGALDAMRADYRAAIEAALPPSVSLCGDEFIGPHRPDDGEWDGYPVNSCGELDIKACVEGIDLEPILARHDIITLEEIGRYEMKSTAKAPASVASRAMKRLGIKPLARAQIDGEGQPVSVYNAATVREALAARPGRGARTDLKDARS